MPAQKPEAIPKLDQVIGTRIGDCEPSAGSQHAPHFGEVLRCEDVDDEISCRVVDRPFAPEIRYREGRRRPTSGSLPYRVLRDVEAEADGGARHLRSHSSDVMTRARTSIQDMLRPWRGSLDMPDDCCRECAEVSCIEKLRALPELRRVVAARSWAASPTEQEIDIALAGEIETVPVSAGECTCRSCDSGFTKRAPEQPMAGPKLERRHDAAPAREA